ncbi:MAG: glycosyltransferase family 2 protein [Planctomycetes bacterium]|nr:glycosyltransferase family 2 protein [Planctomycetota bacterium]
MTQPITSIDLVLPTLNEIEGMKAIWPLIDRSLFHEVIVADGSSTDGTVEYSRAQGLTVVTQPGKGLPDAEAAAYRHSRADALIVFTPDGNSLPELLAPMCAELRAGADVVVGSRYLGAATSADDDEVTGFGNAFFVTLVNLLFRRRYTDVLVALRGYRRSAIEQMGLATMDQENWLRQNFFLMNSWELGSTLRATRLGLRVVEVPGDEPARIGGERKLSIIRNGTACLLQIVFDFVAYRPQRR